MALRQAPRQALATVPQQAPWQSLWQALGIVIDFKASVSLQLTAY